MPAQKSSQSRDAAGKKAGVSGRYVSDAAKLKRDAPTLFNEVKQGTKTLQQAKREAKPKRTPRSVKYPLSTAMWKMMESVTSSAAMVEKDYNDSIEEVLNHPKFDPDKRVPLSQLIVSFVTTLDTWKQSCNTIIKKTSANSETNSSPTIQTAKGRRRKK